VGVLGRRQLGGVAGGLSGLAGVPDRSCTRVAAAAAAAAAVFRTAACQLCDFVLRVFIFIFGCTASRLLGLCRE